MYKLRELDCTTEVSRRLLFDKWFKHGFIVWVEGVQGKPFKRLVLAIVAGGFRSLL